jgi:hypothetical protein
MKIIVPGMAQKVVSGARQKLQAVSVIPARSIRQIPAAGSAEQYPPDRPEIFLLGISLRYLTASVCRHRQPM